jgi:hypothetical protein
MEGRLMGKDEYVGEYEPFLPEVAADLKHWGSMAYWTLEESVAVLLGQDPLYVNWAIAKDYQESPDATELSLNYAKLRTFILRAFEKHEITDPISPAIFLAWADSRSLEIPEELKLQIETVKKSDFSMDDAIKGFLEKKDEEIAALRERVEALESLAWDGFDETQSTYSKELAIAVKAHSAVSKNCKKGMSVKQQIILWLEANYPKLRNEEKERMAKICNWQKSGGAPCTP